MRMRRGTCLTAMFSLICCSSLFTAYGQDRSTEGKGENFETAQFSLAKGAGVGVKVDGRLTRGSVRINNNNIPSWKVEVTVANHTKQAVRLGESMTVLEKVSQIDQLLGIYVARASKHETGHLKRMSLRYGLFWGIEVGADSFGMWPLTALPGGSSMSMTDVFLLVLSSPWVKPYFPDGGYPTIPAGQQVVLREEILVPLRERSQNTLLLPPLVLEEGKAPVQSVLRFSDVSTAADGQVLVASESTRYSADDAAVAPVPADSSQPLWLRLHALNWMAESRFDRSAEMLMKLASDQNAPRPIRISALINLGLNQHKPAVPVMLAALANKSDAFERAVGIAALGELRDPSIAVQLRPFLNDSDETVVREAIQAVGNLKDSESVGTLLRMLVDGRKENQYGAITESLVQIATPDAWTGLIAVAGERKSGFQPRRTAVLALGSARYVPAVPMLSKVLADEGDVAGMRMNVVSALSSIGGAEAIGAIRAACSARDKSVAESAMRAMSQSKDPAARSFLIEVAGKSGHSMRESAIKQIASQKIHEAAPILKAMVQDPTTPADLLPETLGALTAIGEKVGPDELALVWSAYQRERDASSGEQLADSLIAAKFNDKQAIPILIAGLDEDKNKLWYSHIKLLRHLTGEKIGPEYRFGDKKSHKVDFDKWREWWTQQPK